MPTCACQVNELVKVLLPLAEHLCPLYPAIGFRDADALLAVCRQWHNDVERLQGAGELLLWPPRQPTSNCTSEHHVATEQRPGQSSLALLSSARG